MQICRLNPDGSKTDCLNLPHQPPYGFGNHYGPASRERTVAKSHSPGHYPELLNDAMIINAVNDAANSASDEGVREALRRGVQAAIDAIQEHSGNKYKISLDEQSAGASA